MIYELKDCPFCGGEPTFRTDTSNMETWVSVRCNECLVQTCWRTHEVDATEDWNRRAQPASFITSPEALCKGAWELGTACGKCARCIATKDATGHD